jgi:proteasome accessory factor B
MARDKTERLLNLLIALMDASRPVSREELRRWLSDQYGTEQSDEAFEKMFERDKDELRSMGIAIEAVTNAHNEVVGYRVDTDGVRLPSITFTAEESAVIATAASVWATAGLAASAHSGRLKIEALGARSDAMDLGVQIRLQAGEPAFVSLLDAATRRRLVRFTYQRPGESTQEREVQPWGLVSREGHWYLVGHDVQRSDTRVFRLDRIHGDVEPDGPAGAFARPDGSDLASLVRQEADPVETVRLRVRPGTAVALRRRAGADLDVEEFELPFHGIDNVVGDIAAQGPNVVVVHPEHVRRAVMAHLKELVS